MTEVRSEVYDSVERRPVLRWTLIAAILGTAVIAAPRLPLDRLPRTVRPELAVDLRLPEALGPAEVTRRWVLPIEDRIRSLGGVEGSTGEVRLDGASWTVVLLPGTDPEIKAARLEAELYRLRTDLPPGGSLRIETGGTVSGDLAAVVWLSGDRTRLEEVVDSVRARAGIRRVDLYGGHEEEIWIEVSEQRAVAAERAARTALVSEDLGWTDHPIRGHVVRAATDRIERIPVPSDRGPLFLGELGRPERRWVEPPTEFRRNGAPTRALFVHRAPEAAPLAVRRTLVQSLDSLPSGISGVLAWNESDDLIRLLRTAFSAPLLAMAAGIALALLPGARRRARLITGILAPLLLAAGTVHGAWLGDVRLDLLTLPVLVVGWAGGFVVLAHPPHRRVRRALLLVVLGTGCLFAGIALAGRELAPLLAEPARALLLGALGSSVAALLLPEPGPVRIPGDGRALGLSFRDPGTVLLVGATVAAGILLGAGTRLLPGPTTLVPQLGDLVVTLTLPEGTSRRETRRTVADLESQIRSRSEVADFWSVIWPGAARITVFLQTGERSVHAARRNATHWKYALHSRGTFRVSAVGAARTRGGGPARVRSLEERPETDDEAMLYRFVLRSTDLDALESAYDGAWGRMARLAIRSHWITGWGDPSVRVYLQPRPDTSRRDLDPLIPILRARSTPPSRLSIPGHRDRALRITSPGRPERADEAPALEAVLNRPAELEEGRVVLPGDLVRPRERRVRPRVLRQSGRFVVPVEVRFPFNSKQQRFETRETLHRSLGLGALPAGVDLERPSLIPSVWQKAELALPALAVAIPLLLLAVAAVYLGSVTGALAILCPVALGLLVGAGWGAAVVTRPDGLFVLGSLGATGIILPWLTAIAEPWWGRARGTASPRRFRAALGTWTRAVPGLVMGIAGLAAGWTVALPTTPWAGTLQAAAITLTVSAVAAISILPALGEAARRMSRRARREARERRHPRPWRVTPRRRRKRSAVKVDSPDSGQDSSRPGREPLVSSRPGRKGEVSEQGSILPRLQARSLTKVYRKGTVALRGVSFVLEPGIVGLLGPNGAGKTSLLRILTGLLGPTRGRIVYRGVSVNDENLAEYRKRIGFLPQFFDAYPDFSAFRFLEHWALELGMSDPSARRERIETLLERVGLMEHRDRKVRDFSGGMRQRIGVARALLDAPPILVVDEPTAGLDLDSRNRFRSMLLEAVGERIVVFSTHIASDLEAVASRLLILHRGRLRFDGAPEELRSRARGRVFQALVEDEELLDFSRRHQVTARVRELTGVRIRAVAGEGGVEGDLVEPGLEEAYLAFLGDLTSLDYS